MISALHAKFFIVKRSPNRAITVGAVTVVAVISGAIKTEIRVVEIAYDEKILKGVRSACNTDGGADKILVRADFFNARSNAQNAVARRTLVTNGVSASKPLNLGGNEIRPGEFTGAHLKHRLLARWREQDQRQRRRYPDPCHPLFPLRRSHQSIFPGFIKPLGSSAAFTARIMAISAGCLRRAMSARRARPTPCSAEIDPKKRSIRS